MSRTRPQFLCGVVEGECSDVENFLGGASGVRVVQGVLLVLASGVSMARGKVMINTTPVTRNTYEQELQGMLLGVKQFSQLRGFIVCSDKGGLPSKVVLQHSHTHRAALIKVCLASSFKAGSSSPHIPPHIHSLLTQVSMGGHGRWSRELTSSHSTNMIIFNAVFVFLSCCWWITLSSWGHTYDHASQPLIIVFIKNI